MKSELKELRELALQEVDPRRLASGAESRGPARLFWGKASGRWCEAMLRLERPGAPWLVVSPEKASSPTAARGVAGLRASGALASCLRGEHPLPGPGSLAAGAGILEFLDSLRREKVSRLTVHLSGGASSLAWVPPAGLGLEELRARLGRLAERGYPIHRLNRERAKLCALKGGGAARWLRVLTPGVRARVEVISDVLPYGPEVVGSGPFWDGFIPHRVLADNRKLVQAFARAAGARGLRVARAEWGCLGDWSEWARDLAARAEAMLARGESGLLLRGGEPSVRLPRGCGRGGRMTQVAAGLLLRLREPIAAGRVAVLCATSDGLDGASRSAGALLDARVARRFSGAGARLALERALRERRSAEPLAAAGALLPPESPRTNVQDLVAVAVETV